MTDTTVTAVLPLRIQAQRKTSDLERFERLLLPSFERFWREPDQLDFLIIVPPGELDVVTARVANHSRFSIRVVSEDAVCPTLSGKRGWHKQQILKLAAAHVVTTTWYLTLDADVMLRRAASRDDLVRDGKAVFHPKQAARHWDWWTASRSVLRSAVHLDPEMVMMDVTPELLHRDVTLELLAQIAQRNEAADPAHFLFESRRAGWTEYSLYWLFVLERQLQHELYRAVDPLYEMAWQPEHVAALAPRADDRASESLFVIVQSTLEISSAEVERLMSRPSTGPAAITAPRTAWSRLARLLPMQWRRCQ